MAVTTIDPGAGSLAQGIASIGQALAFKSREKQFREQELRRNPAQMQALARAFRAAKGAGQEVVFLESIGVTPEFGPQLDAFVATTEERLDVARGKAGFVEQTIEAEAAELAARGPEALVRGRGAEAILETDIFDLTAQNAVSEALRSQRGLNAELVGDLPELEVEARTEEAKRAIQENAFGASLFAKKIEVGFDKIVVDLDVLKARAQMSEIEFKSGTLSDYVEYINSIDTSTEEGKHAKGVMLLGLQNPSALQHIAQHERMNTEALIRLAASQAEAPGLRSAATIRMLNEIRDATKLVGETDNKEQRKAAVQGLNNLRLLAADLMKSGSIFPIDLVGAKERKGELFFDLNVSGKVSAVLSGIQEMLEESIDPLGEVELTPEQKLTKFDELVAASPVDKMTQRQKEEFAESIELARGILIAEIESSRRGEAGFAGLPTGVQTEEADIQDLITVVFGVGR